MKKIFILFLCFMCSCVRAEEKVNYLENLIIENYDIYFDKNIYEYEIVIGDEEHLDIDYELSDDSVYVSVEGNGNFNKSENIITINVNNDYFYKIHAYKTLNVSNIEEFEEIIEMSPLKKEIVKYSLVTISFILIILFYYILFINKSYLKI